MMKTYEEFKKIFKHIFNQILIQSLLILLGFMLVSASKLTALPAPGLMPSSASGHFQCALCPRNNPLYRTSAAKSSQKLS